MDINKLTIILNTYGRDKNIPKAVFEIRYQAKIYHDFRQSLLKFIQKKKHSNKPLDENLMAFAFLCSIEYRDEDFKNKLIKNFNFDDAKFSPTEPKLHNAFIVFSKGMFFLKIQQKIPARAYLLRAFTENRFLFMQDDLSAFIELLWDLGDADNCYQAIFHLNQTYPDSFWAKMRLIRFQCECQHLFPVENNEQILKQNLTYIYKRAVTTKDFFHLGLLCYEAGLENDFYHCFEKAFLKLKLGSFKHNFNKSNEDEAKQHFSAVDCLNSTNDLIKLLEEKAGVQAFLIGGTLLGLHRDGKLMDYDKDADLGILLEGNSLDEHIKQIFDIVGKVCDDGRFMAPWIRIKPPEFTELNTPLIDKKTGISIDLFFFYKQQDKSVVGIYTKLAPLLWVFDEFKVEKYKFPNIDLEYYVPGDIEKFLVTQFNANWREPIAVWDSLVKCPNLAANSQKAVFYYGIQRFYSALENHKYLKAADYYDLLLNRWKYPFSDEVKTHLENLLQQLKTEFESQQNQKI